MNTHEDSILILTGSFGHGHNTAAKNLACAFEALSLPNSPRTEVLDFFNRCYPRTAAFLQRGYAFAINSAPKLWRQIYKFGDTRFAGSLSSRKVNQALMREIQSRHPIAVISTFPLFSLLISRAFGPASSRPFRFSTVITDSISINTMWCRGESDLIFVTDETSKRVVIDKGVPAARIRAHGFPISLREGTNSRLLPPHQTTPRILYLPTTKRPHVRRTLEALGRFCRDSAAQLTVVLGNNEARLRSCVSGLRHEFPDERFSVYGWRDDVPQLMGEHHVVVTKAGGATVSEALAAQCPLLINYVVPGQEEGNAELVMQSRCGLRVHAPDQVEGALTHMLREPDSASWLDCRRRLKAMDRASASRKIVDDILADANLTSRYSPSEELGAELK